MTNHYSPSLDESAIFVYSASLRSPTAVCIKPWSTFNEGALGAYLYFRRPIWNLWQSLEITNQLFSFSCILQFNALPVLQVLLVFPKLDCAC